LKLVMILVGAWMGCSLFMALVATLNFRTVDRVLSQPTPQAGQALATVPAGVRRPLLRHLASELNRLFFRVWGAAQLAVALALLALLVARGSTAAVLALAAAVLVIVAVELFAITPPVVTLGRVLDFLPRDNPPPQLTRFGRLHAAYSVLDLAKLALLCLLAWRVK
jgi:hypothetical protein